MSGDDYTGPITPFNSTESEKTILGYQGLAMDQRLACQTLIVSSGELLVRVMSAKEVDKTTAAEATKSAKELPLDILPSAVQAEVLKFKGAIDAARREVPFIC